jgi:hypothetical protein
MNKLISLLLVALIASCSPNLKIPKQVQCPCIILSAKYYQSIDLYDYYIVPMRPDCQESYDYYTSHQLKRGTIIQHN